MECKHLYTSDEKLKWFGYGEWVEEPDEVYFVHKGINCRVLRVVNYEYLHAAFGGYLCGYVRLDEFHPWCGKTHNEIECDCHGGLTYSQFEKNDEFWIGFDCAHSGDIAPSVELNMRNDPMWQKMKEEREKLFMKLKCAWPRDTYKNIFYVKNECIALAEQATELLAPKL